MIREIKKGLFDFLIYISVCIRKIDSFNKFLMPESHLRKVLVNFRKKIGSMLVGEVYCEANIYGTKIKMIDNRTLDYYYFFSRGEIYEPSFTLQLKALLKESEFPTFVDVGAHYGYFTIYAAFIVGSRGQVISIEPHPKFYRRLLQNIEINRLNENVRTFNVALSEKEGKGMMEGFDERVFKEVETGNVQVLTFDQLCEKENIRPDIVKIDVHGSEGKVLSGMSKTLKNDVKHLFCELHNDMHGYTVGNIIQTLETAGLNVFEFTKHRDKYSGEIVAISDYLFISHNDRMLYARRK